MTNREDALAATRYGADFLGFIFYKPSPRYVTPEQVKDIVSAVRTVQGKSPQFVGVFVNETLEKINAILTDCQLDRVQLHGEEPANFITHFDGVAFKAIRPDSRQTADRLLETYLPVTPKTARPYLLLDAYHPTLYGGTGRVTDWGMAADIAKQYPMMLAGSLTPENVGEAIAAVQPWGVDASSSLEAEKGRKDHEKLRIFIKAVRKIE